VTCRDIGTQAEIAERVRLSNLDRLYVHHLMLARRAVRTAALWRHRGERGEAAYWLNDAARERRAALMAR
jgi:hypothetical protein